MNLKLAGSTLLRNTLALLLLAGVASVARAQTYVNTPFVITINPDEAASIDPTKVWVSFEGTINNTTTAQTIGNQTANYTATWQSYQLSNMSANVGVSFFTTDQYTFSLNSFSGRIYINYGNTALSSQPPADSTTAPPYLLIEPTVLGQVVPGPDASNADLSYVDGVSIAAKLGVYNGTTGQPQSLNTINPIKTNSNILPNVAALAPEAVKVYDGNSTLVRVISSAAAAASVNATINTAYHTWSNLMTTLESTTSTTPLNVGGYISPTQGNLAPSGLSDANLIFVGSPAIPGQAANFDQQQNYVANATFKADLNPAGGSYNATLAGLGIHSGDSGVIISGHGVANPGGGTPTGNFSIYITGNVLNSGTGIYGSNPTYVVVPESGNAYSSFSIGAGNVVVPGGLMNDLSGRIVGDLMAGMVFGWSNSTIDIADQAAATGTNLYGLTFSSTILGKLTTGEYFMLMSLAAAQGKLADWIGSAIDPNADNWDPYAVAVGANSDAYGTGFGDRISGIISPDISWYTANAPANPFDPGHDFDTVGFVGIELGGNSVNAVPEPAESALIVSLGGLISAMYYRRRQRKP